MKHSAKMPTQRQLRVAEEIKKIIAGVFIRGDLPMGNTSSVTVTEVQISPDFSHAKAFVMTLGGAGVEETVDFLNEYKGFFRKSLGKNLSIRVTPDIRFMVDETFDEAHKIDTLLHSPKVRKDLSAG